MKCILITHRQLYQYWFMKQLADDNGEDLMSQNLIGIFIRCEQMMNTNIRYEKLTLIAQKNITTKMNGYHSVCHL